MMDKIIAKLKSYSIFYCCSYLIVFSLNITGGPPSIEMRGSKAAEFVLKCLVKIPTKICVALANKVSYELTHF